MKITELPKQSNLQAVIPDVPDVDEIIPELVGEEFPSELNDGDFEAEVKVNMDVILYTERTVGRPWLGRVLKIEEDSCFLLQWYGGKSRGNTFYARYNKDGTPFTSKQSFSSVMFWDMGTEKEENSFKLTHKWLEKIMEEYDLYDNSQDS